MEDSIPFRIFKPLPALMTRHLCGAQQAAAIGVDARVSGWSRGHLGGQIGCRRTSDRAQPLPRCVAPRGPRAE
jgi:hypothetical protein